MKKQNIFNSKTRFEYFTEMDVVSVMLPIGTFSPVF